MPKQIIRKLQIGFGISLLVLIASSTASYISIKKQIDNRNQLVTTQQLIQSVNHILIDLQNAETGQRGFYLTNKESFLEPYLKSQASLPQSFRDARSLLSKESNQGLRLDSLSSLVDTRMSILGKWEKQKRAGINIASEQLEEGKVYMDSCRNLIERFLTAEHVVLKKQNAELDSSSNITSIFIVIAAIFSLLITIVFYMQIRGEFRRREKLQNILKEKDEEMRTRVRMIEQIAKRVSAGDYSVRVDDAEKDELGSLANSLNGMTISLDNAFGKIHDNEWKQTGLALLNEVLVGNKNERMIAEDALAHLINYGRCINGALYLLDKNQLVLRSYYGLEGQMRENLKFGEGIVGQVFLDKRIKLLEDIDNSEFTVSFTNGQLKLKHILWLPLMLEGQCYGVFELGTFDKFEALTVSFFEEAGRIIALELLAAHGRNKVQNLLEETQAQSEELQTQHSELENLNTELEAQAQKLQASDEELRVQQEELLQSNQELEERSKLLEEKNELIASRNEEIQKKAEELALTTKYKSEFLANMSHELRTPLNSILLLSRLLSENVEENLTDEQVESANVIQSSGTGLLTLIDEILDLSKIEAGKMDLEYQQVSISALCKELESLFRPLVQEKGIDLSIDIDDSIPDIIETDKLRLEQVLRNLLSNAIKFTIEGGVSFRVSSCRTNSNFIQFAVKDTGIGISPDNQKLIFEAFQQADGSTRRKFGGTGLGLSISREIMRLLGGEITLVSKPEEGSTFTIAIPLDKSKTVVVDSADIELVPQEPVSTVEDPIAIDSLSYRTIEIPEDVADDRDNIREGDKLILIVEDDTNFAKALLKYTRQQKYKGIVLVRGDLVLEIADKYQPLAILLDIQLPIKDGWQVMDDLKNNSKTRHIPVHMMSSLRMKRESLMKGAIDFINKPIAIEEIGRIFERIEDALNRNPKKVLIVEENEKHATALSYFLSNFNIQSEIKENVSETVDALLSEDVNCVILDMGIPDKIGYQTLEAIKANPGLENLPIIVFTGKQLSQIEELKIKQFADSIVVKTAHSFQRILDEVGLFLHLVEENNGHVEKKRINKLGSLSEVLVGKTVLVADDDVRNIFSLTKTLEPYQMEVLSATNGKEALDVVKQNPNIAVVLMDMMMPEMDGYETIREIRKMPAFARLPIIAVTAKAMIGDREKCIQAGASDYISKPVDKDQLLSLLRVWLYESKV
ncbi:MULTISPECIES: response regulator [Sphingobacterium]|uniref:response regulator n=1 Tax=Sphingobacterium TaxID=28453 RepID=UPI0013DB8F89|nr:MULTISPECIES: response regulator [unclassified Sphingobacterium]